MLDASFFGCILHIYSFSTFYTLMHPKKRMLDASFFGCILHIYSFSTFYTLIHPKKRMLDASFFYASSVLLFNFLYLDASLKKDAWCIFFLCILPTPFQLFIHWCTLKKGCLMHPKKGCMRPFFKCACDGRVRSMSVDWVQQRGLPREFFSIMLIML